MEDTVPLPPGTRLEQIATGAGGVVTTIEETAGRVTFREDQVPSECDAFANRRFDLTETAEALEVTVEVRVHEQIAVLRTRTTRVHVVTAALRREMADIDDRAGEPDPIS